MTKDEINEEACEHCNQVMCSVCENRTCDNTHLATLKCREWRDRRAGYYCGAESREKRITELEKENAELKETCNKWFEHLKNREEELLNELNNQNAKYESQIEELEKENAELKEKLNFSTQYYQGEKAKEQLTEAKEIIKMLHSDCYSIAECEDTNLGLWEDDLAKAEQFICEVE